MPAVSALIRDRRLGVVGTYGLTLTENLCMLAYSTLTGQGLSKVSAPVDMARAAVGFLEKKVPTVLHNLLAVEGLLATLFVYDREAGMPWRCCCQWARTTPGIGGARYS